MAYRHPRLKKPFTSTRRKKFAFFLCRNLGLRLAAILRAAGFDVITHQAHYGSAVQIVSDPEVIEACRKLGRSLITADDDFLYTWAAEIRRAKIAVFHLSNNYEGPDIWGPRIASARLDIERELRNRAKPFTANISRDGRISYILRYYRKKTKKRQLSQDDHITFEFEAPTPENP